MAKHSLKLACMCGNDLCRKAVHVIGNPRHGKVRLTISEDGAVANVTLKPEGARILGRWLLDMEEEAKPRTTPKSREQMPWEVG